jgi:restriction system protein
MAGNNLGMIPITPTEFELQVKTWLEGASKELKEFRVTHCEELPGPGGEYEIDAVARFEVFGGAEITVLAECKHHRYPIERDVVMLLDAKLRETGAHKGIVFSTSRFQSGALQYAKAHGIATVQVRPGEELRYKTKESGSVSEPSLYRYIGWMITVTEEDEESRDLVADDYHGAMRKWFLATG